jgi:hypothetical protein
LSNPGVIFEQPAPHRTFQPPVLAVKRSISATNLCCIHGAAVAVPVLLLRFGAAPWWTLGIGGLVMSLAYIYIGYAEGQRETFWLSPLSFFFWWYFVGYGVSAIYAATQTYDPGFLPLVSQVVPGEDIAAGYIVTLIGALALHVSYSAVRHLRSNGMQARQDTSERSDFRLWFFGFTLGLVEMWRPELFSSLGAGRSILQHAPFGILLSFCLLSSEYFSLDRIMYRFLFVSGNVLLIVVAFISGSKYTSMLALLPAFSALLARPKLKKMLPLMVVGGAGIYLFIVAPIIATARLSNVDESRSQRIRSAAGETVSTFSEDVEFALMDQVERFLYRQFESTSAGFIVGDVRDHGFRYGETMQNLTYAFIPRLLWPEKPMVTRGNWFTSYLGAAGSEQEAATSTGIYSAAELYWNFGYPGIIFGMALMGSLFALIFSMIGAGPHQLVIPMVIFINLNIRIVEQASASEVFVGLIYLLVLTFLYRYFSLPTSGVQNGGFVAQAKASGARHRSRPR